MALEGSIARRYARALLEIGLAQQNYEKVSGEVASMAALLASSAELKSALGNPVFPLSQRKALLSRLAERLQLSPAVRNFVLLVMDRGRIGQLPDMARELATLADQKAGRVRATVTSVTPLPEDLVNALRTAMEKRLGKDVILEGKQDPALLGGMVAKVGDVLYDGSIRTQLDLARQQILGD